MRKKKTLADLKHYLVTNVDQARDIAQQWLDDNKLTGTVFGLPEIDDRYLVWKVSVLNIESAYVGEIVIDVKTGAILKQRTTEVELMQTRLASGKDIRVSAKSSNKHAINQLDSMVLNGDCEDMLKTLPDNSVDLVFTSPPYFNAKPEANEFVTYEAYLSKMRNVIKEAHRVLSEGRFFVMNVSPVLVRRVNRGQSSKRIAVPFDFHRIFIEEGYDFVDDIIWEKPEGAGWAIGRGRRFAADRSPLQYKPVVVTEYVLVYRKQTDKLIDWNIRGYSKKVREMSQIEDDYEKTNVWKIKPSHTSEHPAVFPQALAERVVKYYSFKGDVVLDPFAGTGTTARAAWKNGRKYVMIESEARYFNLIMAEHRKHFSQLPFDVEDVKPKVKVRRRKNAVSVV